MRADRALLRQAIEGGLRWEPPLHGIARVATVDTELGGVAIKAGAVLSVAIGAANRDETRYPEPDRFDIFRDPQQHIAGTALIMTAILVFLAPIALLTSMIRSSISLIVTGSVLIDSTQASSHGAGHSVPVNSGKLFVACSCSIASRQWPPQIRSFHSGMRLPSGQPWWQNGTPQSMHRPAWRRSRLSGNGS